MNEFIPNLQKLLESSDMTFAAQAAGVVFIILLSACLSSSISEKKLRGHHFSFIMGATLPVIAPILLLFIPKKYKKNVIQETLVPEVKKDDELELPLNDLNEEYFKKIYIDHDGKFTGPYYIDMETNIIKAEAITEIHREFIVIDTLNANGKKQRQRIPYAKITSCSLA
ncbi:MAG: hypothetical protein HRT88_02785 [Lentisphaeraceae bacterium]|nr:hypothetical protein [Lentisphaeraceae bacterium]